MVEKPNKSEYGQAIVYLVLGLVVFLGFVALAIDGGAVLADRRHTQNAADAASLAGAGEVARYLNGIQNFCAEDWRCGDDIPNQAKFKAEQAAVDRAAPNGFDITKVPPGNDPSGNNWAYAQCFAVAYTGYTDKYLDVTVDILSTTQTNFAQIFFGNQLQNHVDSTARVRPPQPVALGNAIVALNTADCFGNQNGVIVNGNGQTLVEGGGIFSNGCLSASGTPTVTITGGKFPVGHDLSHVGDLGLWDPDPESTTVYMATSDFGIPVPDCSDPAAHNVAANALPTDLTPGLWCITGNVRLQGVGGRLHGTGVTLYLKDGVFEANGNADVQLSGLDAVAPAIPGIVIYLGENNSSTITLNGNSGSYYEGLIYAPKSTITMEGTGDVIYQDSQVIGLNVFVGGNADTKVVYDRCRGYQSPARVELSK